MGSCTLIQRISPEKPQSYSNFISTQSCSIHIDTKTLEKSFFVHVSYHCFGAKVWSNMQKYTSVLSLFPIATNQLLGLRWPDCCTVLLKFRELGSETLHEWCYGQWEILTSILSDSHDHGNPRYLMPIPRALTIRYWHWYFQVHCRLRPLPLFFSFFFFYPTFSRFPLLFFSLHL